MHRKSSNCSRILQICIILRYILALRGKAFFNVLFLMCIEKQNFVAHLLRHYLRHLANLENGVPIHIKTNIQTLCFNHVSDDKVLSRICSLNNSSSCDHYDLSSNIIKEPRYILTSPITHFSAYIKNNCSDNSHLQKYTYMHFNHNS